MKRRIRPIGIAVLLLVASMPAQLKAGTKSRPIAPTKTMDAIEVLVFTETEGRAGSSKVEVLQRKPMEKETGSIRRRAHRKSLYLGISIGVVLASTMTLLFFL